MLVALAEASEVEGDRGGFRYANGDLGKLWEKFA
jgi:hypothetical protein